MRIMMLVMWLLATLCVASPAFAQDDAGPIVRHIQNGNTGQWIAQSSGTEYTWLTRSSWSGWVQGKSSTTGTIVLWSTYGYDHYIDFTSDPDGVLLIDEITVRVIDNSSTKNMSCAYRVRDDLDDVEEYGNDITSGTPGETTLTFDIDSPTNYASRGTLYCTMYTSLYVLSVEATYEAN